MSRRLVKLVKFVSWPMCRFSLDCLIMELFLLVGLQWQLALVIGRLDIRATLFSFLDIIVGTQDSILGGRIGCIGIGIDLSRIFGSIFG